MQVGTIVFNIPLKCGALGHYTEALILGDMFSAMCISTWVLLRKKVFVNQEQNYIVCIV